MWPEFKGRDGCRTPMPWDSRDANFGFGAGKPWLPVAETHRGLAVDVQEPDAASLLNHYRRLLAWRRTVPALIHGEMDLLPATDAVLAFVRRHGTERVLCAFNLSGGGVTYELPAGHMVQQALEAGSGAKANGTQIAFEPWGVLFAHLT